MYQTLETLPATIDRLAAFEIRTPNARPALAG
jgi:hypothetical protein